ncbi:hypothetical protein [Nocardioides renjunii]|uniref:hypothetical protein n=1 Tax=Nocardioides renjunii TaxID=3095075 RepID=UPI002AFF1E60|nr:hypothetical protein [Nocardioides sp. S-34]WQQ24279.1 hypothetical protein SHK17_09880 [Nocardioides sp. S-34]
MNKALLSSLTEKEAALVREADPAGLLDLDEDQLLELHDRVRRERTKHLKVYRRGASAAVADVGGRGKAYDRNQRARAKAEVFESVLAQVSRQVSAAARNAAQELRAERIAEARSTTGGGPPRPASARDGGTPVPSTRRRTTRTTGGLKKDASSRAQGARRQVARDAR